MFQDAKIIIYQMHENALFMLQKGCSNKEIAGALHVSVGSLHNLCHEHFSNIKKL
jgi:DNA-binding NarL/FixJ family response regulator